jgi:hypothetical protein
MAKPNQYKRDHPDGSRVHGYASGRGTIIDND